MNDRELLELAAKAAGIPIEWHQEMSGPFPCYKIEGGYREWNPLRQDADALRLLHKLRLSLDFDMQNSQVVCANFRCAEPLVFREDICLPDVYRSSRRAIVRAAAAIGRAMP